MIKGLNYYWQFTLNQYRKHEHIEKSRDRQLQRIISHAYSTIPFYHDLMEKAGVKPGDINRAEDLRLIPSVSRNDIQGNQQAFISRVYDPGDCLSRTTSGSSGKVVKVLWDRDNFWARIFLFYRSFTMIGYNPFKKAVYFLPDAEDTGFSFGLYRVRHLPLDKPFPETARILTDFRPHILSAYPSYLLDLGRNMTEKDISRMSLQAISLNSEIILPHDRSLISEMFHCPVYDEYSAVETGMIASMCSHGSMHVFTDNVILEILDDNDKPVPHGQTGNVVLTTLNSFAMPFIRYRIGDLASLQTGTCPCGRPFPILGPVEGRKDDAFIMADGTAIPAWRIYEIVERPVHVDDRIMLNDFYLVQRARDKADFYYVPGPDFTSGYIDAIKSRSREIFGDNFNFTIHRVDDIDRVKTVKRKYIHIEKH